MKVGDLDNCVYCFKVVRLNEGDHGRWRHESRPGTPYSDGFKCDSSLGGGHTSSQLFAPPQEEVDAAIESIRLASNNRP